MTRIVQIVFAALCLFFININTYAQTKKWETEKTKDGKVTVKYGFSERIGTKGEEEQVVEYVATTTAVANIKKLVAIMKDVSKHKEFMGQETSSKIKSISEDECIVYYFYKGVWPYPNSDLVEKMTYREDAGKKTTTFSLTAAPTLLEDKGVKRLDFYNLTYLFKEIGNGVVELTLAAKFTPAVQLPAFIMSSWFPDGPADYLTGIIKLANETK